MSYDIDTGFHWMKEEMSQSLWNRAVSYDHKIIHSGGAEGSQSLWNRAVSYDLARRAETVKDLQVSIPLEQGSVLRP